MFQSETPFKVDSDNETEGSIIIVHISGCSNGRNGTRADDECCVVAAYLAGRRILRHRTTLDVQCGRAAAETTTTSTTTTTTIRVAAAAAATRFAAAGGRRRPGPPAATRPAADAAAWSCSRAKSACREPDSAPTGAAPERSPGATSDRARRPTWPANKRRRLVSSPLAHLRRHRRYPFWYSSALTHTLKPSRSARVGGSFVFLSLFLFGFFFAIRSVPDPIQCTAADACVRFGVRYSTATPVPIMAAGLRWLVVGRVLRRTAELERTTCTSKAHRSEPSTEDGGRPIGSIWGPARPPALRPPRQPPLSPPPPYLLRPDPNKLVFLSVCVCVCVCVCVFVAHIHLCICVALHTHTKHKSNTRCIRFLG